MNMNHVFSHILGSDWLRVRWSLDEIRILKHNLFVIANFVRDNSPGLPGNVLNLLCDGMELVVNNLDTEYELIFGILLDHKVPELWEYLYPCEA